MRAPAFWKLFERAATWQVFEDLSGCEIEDISLDRIVNMFGTGYDAFALSTSQHEQ